MKRTLILPEEWRTVVGMPGYEVSNNGRIRSVDRHYDRPHPRNPTLMQRRKVTGRCIRPSVTINGYLQLSTTRHGVKSIHRAVVEAFVYNGPIPGGLIVCHKDGDKTNNNITNLYAGTYFDNRNDAIKHGTLCLRPRAKLTWEAVCQIRESDLSDAEAAAIYGISRRNVGLIRTNSTWRQE